MLKLVFKLTFVTFILVIGLKLKVFSVHNLCGWKNVKNGGVQGLNYKCNCLGNTDYIVDSYKIRAYCSGINFSYNELLNTDHRNADVPIYDRKEIYTVYVDTREMGATPNRPKGVIVVLNSDGEKVKEGWVDPSGINYFMLPSGSYTFKMKSGYQGSKEVELRGDTTVTLELTQILD
jgi:hypothetical protein